VSVIRDILQVNFTRRLAIKNGLHKLLSAIASQERFDASCISAFATQSEKLTYVRLPLAMMAMPRRPMRPWVNVPIAGNALEKLEKLLSKSAMTHLATFSQYKFTSRYCEWIASD